LLWKGPSMPCNEALQVQAYFDGELDATAAVAVEQHLASCSECAALYAGLDATRKLVRESAAYHRADDDLRQSITEMLDREGGQPAKSRRRYIGDRKFLSGLASGVGATALAAVTVFFLAAPPAPNLLVADVTNAHLRSLMSDHLIDVVSTDHHTVKPWFAGHTDVSPPVTNFAKQGFTLVGGRADYVDGHRAAVVVYRHGLHVINVFTWSANGEKLPDVMTRDGYHIVFWQSGDLVFCAVSDTGEGELAELVRLMKETKS
jgi:anti-sigma factor RsiW